MARMNRKRKAASVLGVIIFAVGFLAGVALLCITVWGDLEASLFDPNLNVHRDRALALRCPVVMTATETGTVSAAVRNPLDRPAEFKVRTHVSDGFVTLMREIDTKIPLAPGETTRASWAVSPDDATYGYLILVKAILYRKYPLPGRLGSCGILVLDLPFLSGKQLYALLVGTSLVGMTGGMGLWLTGNRPLRGTGLQAARAMGALAGAIVVGLVISALGLWTLGGIILVAIIILGSAIAGYFVNRPAAQ